MNEPNASNAATSLAASERIAALVRSRASQNLISWLTAMAVATTFYLTGVGVAGRDGLAIGILSGLLGTAIVSVTAMFLSTSVVGSREQMRRWRRSVLAWMLALGAALGVGLPLFPGLLWYWAPVAILSAVPLMIGIALESRE